MVPDCPECLRLWREYAKATHHHFKLESDLQIAAYSFDHDRVAVYQPQVEAALYLRQQLREAIEEHERAAHPAAVRTAGHGAQG